MVVSCKTKFLDTIVEYFTYPYVVDGI